VIGVGDLVVCIKRGKWSVVWVGPEATPADPNRATPIFGETCRVEYAAIEADGVLYLDLEGYPLDTFDARRFRPLNDSHDDAELIERIKNCGKVSA
jgi:hypothetical protein